VPGPQRAVHALGRKLLVSYPYVPIVGTIRFVVAIFSYDGGLYFGVTGDRDHAPDIEVLTAGIESGLADLVQRARTPAAATPTPGAPVESRCARRMTFLIYALESRGLPSAAEPPAKEEPMSVTTTSIARARDVTRRYGEGATAVDALRGVSLDVEKGQLVA